MREKNKRIPDPGKQFSYIVMKGPRLRDEKGKFIPYRVGDYMEYPSNIGKEQNMKIDINYYLDTTVAICARFINKNDSYQPHLSHKIMQIKDPDMKEKKIDKYFQDEAISFIGIMAELRDQISQYTGFEPNKIRLPITEEDKQIFCKIIIEQEGMTDIIIDDYQFLQQYGHNGKEGESIHIGWLLVYTVAYAEKILINSSKDLSEKVLAHIEKRFEEVPLAPVLI
ncbi:11538_t:CDS:2, partial [Funneliformis geosporum]